MRADRLILAVSLHASVAAMAADSITIPRDGHAALKAMVDRPEGKPIGGFLLAPGQGYAMDKPLIAESARELAAAGFVVLRFDWGYYTEGGSPTGDRELGDLAAAHAHLRSLAEGLPLLIGGKSMGSALVLVYLRDGMKGLSGVALLTPPCRSRCEDLPLLTKASHPLFLALGDHDPLCDPKTLTALPLPPQAKLVVLPGGNHGLSVEGDAKASAANVQRAATELARWAKEAIAGD